MIAWSQLPASALEAVWSTEALIPEIPERYEFEAFIGRGGQGSVHRAMDRRLGRFVAIKLVQTENIERLRSEAELLARLNHPSVPQVYEDGLTTEGEGYVVMEYIAGARLDEWLASDPTLQERLAVFTQIAAAIEHAHGRGVLHRDIKPANIIVGDDGRAVLLDWGLAAGRGDRGICGSPIFAAPEQLDGQVTDHRADVFCLGVLAYYLISGQTPYHRTIENFEEFRRLRSGLVRIPLHRRVPLISRGLSALCDRAMSPQPGARFQSVKALMQNLEHCQSPKRSIWGWILALMIVGTLGFLAGWWWQSQTPKEIPPETPEETPVEIPATETPEKESP